MRAAERAADANSDELDAVVAQLMLVTLFSADG
jgi:hypothetical protein